MNYALFLSSNQFGVIPTELSPGVSERMLNGQCVTLLVAPRAFVDMYLNLNPHDTNYQYKREYSRTQNQMKDAVLTFFYGEPFERTHTDIPLETTAEVIG